jgi:predicted phosphodiesterase
MRYGVLSDIHGNLDALQAVVDVLEKEGVDHYLCAGDLVGYGPFPNECVELLGDLGAVCVAGNHDLIALGRLTDDRCGVLARESLRWTRQALGDGAKCYLGELPRQAGTCDGIVIAHGSLDDPEEYTRRSEQARLQLDQLEQERPYATTLILGHTHLPWAFDRWDGSIEFSGDGSVSLVPARQRLLNPGAIGQSRERLPLARFVLLDLERQLATFYAVPYNVERCRRALRCQGLPPNSCHLPPSRLAGWSAPVRRVVRRATPRKGRS